MRHGAAQLGNGVSVCAGVAIRSSSYGRSAKLTTKYIAGGLQALLEWARGFDRRLFLRSRPRTLCSKFRKICASTPAAAPRPKPAQWRPPMLDLEDIFGAAGPLARALTDFRSAASSCTWRSASLRRSPRASRSWSRPGTGTGKTFAYLVPALLSGRRVLISTGTRTLQDQLFTKDLPLVAAPRPSGARGAAQGARQLPVPLSPRAP